MENRFEVDGKDYYIKMSPEALVAGKKAHSRALREALEDGALLRKRLMSYMKEQGVWDDKKEAEYQAFVKTINSLESKLSAGKMKISEGKAVAIELAETRAKFRALITDRNDMDTNTAEGQADNARFNALLAKSVFDYDTQKLVFPTVEDYIQKGSEPLSLALASKFANFLYGVDEKYEDNLVENKFLRRFKIIDEKGRFIDKDGNLVDIDGKRVDEEGYYIDEAGNRVDSTGVSLDVNVETAEFEEG